MAWFNDAMARAGQPNPNAFTLATIDPDGRPAARILLCKAIDPSAGAIVFFTNYTSRKGEALLANPQAAACFHWDALDRQVRIEGRVSKVSDAVSDDYFASRPLESRIGAWASEQSRPVASRAQMQDRVAQTMRRFGLDPDRPPAPGVAIPRPPHWGGFSLLADRVELWVSGPGRVHDRAAWTRALVAGRGGPWRATRLQP
jgi:pyridoxamine 5'-phosphate oxidase